MENPNASNSLETQARKAVSNAELSNWDLEQYRMIFEVDFSKMKGKSVLDIGSGTNEKFSLEALKKGVKVFSINPRLVVEEGVKDSIRQPEIHPVSSLAQRMPYKNNTFDYEFALFSVPYYLPRHRDTLQPDSEHYEKLFQEIIRTLKPKGKAYFCPILKNRSDVGDLSQNIKIPAEFVIEILDQFSNSIEYKIDEIRYPYHGQLVTESRLVITKKD